MSEINAIRDMSLREIFAAAKPFLIALLIFAVGHFVIVLLMRGVMKGLRRSKLDQLVVDLLGKVMSIALHVMVLLSSLSALGVSTTGLLAALSAVGAGVALALKDSLSNIAGGIVLLTSPRFMAGDYIIFDGNTSEEGQVISVDLMHTTIVTYNKRQLSLPNGLLANGKIINLTREPYRRVDINFPVPYDTDIPKAREILLGVIKSHPLSVVDETHSPSVRVNGYGDSAILLATRAWCRSGDYWPIYHELMENYLTAMAAQGITVPFNRLDVAMVPEEKA